VILNWDQPFVLLAALSSLIFQIRIVCLSSCLAWCTKSSAPILFMAMIVSILLVRSRFTIENHLSILIIQVNLMSIKLMYFQKNLLTEKSTRILRLNSNGSMTLLENERKRKKIEFLYFCLRKCPLYFAMNVVGCFDLLNFALFYWFLGLISSRNRRQMI